MTEKGQEVDGKAIRELSPFRAAPLETPTDLTARIHRRKLNKATEGIVSFDRFKEVAISRGHLRLVQP